MKHAPPAARNEFRVIDSFSRITRLGEGVSGSGRLSDDAMDRTIDALKVFDLVFVMTQGGPADTTNLLQFYGYKKSFAEGMIGYGSAIAVVVFLLSFCLSVLYIRLLGTGLLRKAQQT